MLICGKVNPPPPEDPNYNGVYFSQKDNMSETARGLKNLPIWVEHDSRTVVGKVLQGWVDPREGSMWALAELNVKDISGAMAASAVEHNRLQDFSLGYSIEVNQSKDGRMNVDKKIVHEVSLVKCGARENCHIFRKEKVSKSDDHNRWKPY